MGASCYRKRGSFRWHGLFVGRRKNVWRATPLCLFWTVWKKINLRAFENEEHSVKFLKMFFSRNLFAWVKRYTEILSVFI